MDELTCRTVLALTESLNRAISENIYQREVIRGLEGRIKGLEARLGERPVHRLSGRAPGGRSAGSGLRGAGNATCRRIGNRTPTEERQ